MRNNRYEKEEAETMTAYVGYIRASFLGYGRDATVAFTLLGPDSDVSCCQKVMASKGEECQPRGDGKEANSDSLDTAEYEAGFEGVEEMVDMDSVFRLSDGELPPSPITQIVEVIDIIGCEAISSPELFKFGKESMEMAGDEKKDHKVHHKGCKRKHRRKRSHAEKVIERDYSPMSLGEEQEHRVEEGKVHRKRMKKNRKREIEMMEEKSEKRKVEMMEEKSKKREIEKREVEMMEEKSKKREVEKRVEKSEKREVKMMEKKNEKREVEIRKETKRRDTETKAREVENYFPKNYEDFLSCLVKWKPYYSLKENRGQWDPTRLPSSYKWLNFLSQKTDAVLAFDSQEEYKTYLIPLLVIEALKEIHNSFQIPTKNVDKTKVNTRTVKTVLEKETGKKLLQEVICFVDRHEEEKPMFFKGDVLILRNLDTKRSRKWTLVEDMAIVNSVYSHGSSDGDGEVQDEFRFIARLSVGAYVFDDVQFEVEHLCNVHAILMQASAVYSLSTSNLCHHFLKPKLAVVSYGHIHGVNHNPRVCDTKMQTALKIGIAFVTKSEFNFLPRILCLSTGSEQRRTKASQEILLTALSTSPLVKVLLVTSNGQLASDWLSLLQLNNIKWSSLCRDHQPVDLVKTTIIADQSNYSKDIVCWAKSKLTHSYLLSSAASLELERVASKVLQKTVTRARVVVSSFEDLFFEKGVKRVLRGTRFNCCLLDKGTDFSETMAVTMSLTDFGVESFLLIGNIKELKSEGQGKKQTTPLLFDRFIRCKANVNF